MDRMDASSTTLLTDRIGRIASMTEPAAKLLNLSMRVVEKQYLALALFFEEPREGIYLGMREATPRRSARIEATLRPREGPARPVHTHVRERWDGFLEWTIDPAA